MLRIGGGLPDEEFLSALEPGGTAEKNPLLMQIYADVTGSEMRLSRSSQSCALGSAIAASVVAGAHPDFATAQAAMTGMKEITYRPGSNNQQIHEKSIPSIARFTTPSVVSQAPLILVA